MKLKTIRFAVGLALTAVGFSAHAQLYTATTAPDPISREILGHPLTSLKQGAPQVIDPRAIIHKNFPQLIEQNFARMDPQLAANIVGRLSPAELSDLAQLYVNAVSDNKQPARLLNVLANRLQTPQLMLLVKHFGYTPIRSAVVASAPMATRLSFIKAPATPDIGPTPGEQRFGPNGKFAPQQQRISYYGQPRMMPAGFIVAGSAVWMMRVDGLQSLSPFLDMTLAETYMTFRVSPAMGLLSVQASLFSTAVVWGNVGGMGYLGWQFGSKMAPLVATYFPGFYNGLGASIDFVSGVMQGIFDSFGKLGAANAEASAANTMQLTDADKTFFETTGGLFGEASAWSIDLDGDGGGAGGSAGHTSD